MFVYKAESDKNLSIAHKVLQNYYEHAIGVLTHVDRYNPKEKTWNDLINNFFNTGYGKYCKFKRIFIFF